MVSTQASQSTRAVKPGPTPTTVGAISRVVPRFRLARIASTTTSGESSATQRASGSAMTAMSPPATTDSASAAVPARTPRASSTRVWPRRMASDRHTVRLIEVGTLRSQQTTRRPARQSRSAMPVAMSPAPRITQSMGGLPWCRPFRREAPARRRSGPTRPRPPDPGARMPGPAPRRPHGRMPRQGRSPRRSSRAKARSCRPRPRPGERARPPWPRGLMGRSPRPRVRARHITASSCRARIASSTSFSAVNAPKDRRNAPVS